MTELSTDIMDTQSLGDTQQLVLILCEGSGTVWLLPFH